MMFEGMLPLEFDHAGTRLRGYVAHPDSDRRRPAVLVMHNAMGIADEDVVEPWARRLVGLGYVAVCTDMYGAHLEGVGQEGWSAAYRALGVENPDRQRARTVAWFNRVRELPYVDPSRVAAIGFCYGGTTALELARSGAELRAAISYHGILTTYRPAEPGALKGEIAIYTGGGDPWAPQNDVDGFRSEMQAAGHRHYQITSFGAADHGFTDPGAAERNIAGVTYHELSTVQAWAGTVSLLEHVFR